ncbi:MAG: exopolyphosphatase [Bacillaceae bacterium]
MEKCSVIDIGSNSIRLVIYEMLESVYIKELENCKVTAKLDNFLTEDSDLRIEGIDIIVKTLNYFKELLKEYNVTKVVCVATATIRKANNGHEIVKHVYEKTGLHIRILTGEEEATYGLFGILHATTAKDGFTVDIGGGSTEITYFSNRQAKHVISFPFGILSLKKRFVKKNVPTEKEQKIIEDFLVKQFSKLTWIHEQNGDVFAIGGSARNVVKVYQHLTNYPLDNTHLFSMEKEGIEFVLQFIRSLTYEELQQLEPLSKERADTIILALLVFKVMMELVNGQQFTLSGKGLREGIYYDNFAFKKVNSQLKEDSVQSFLHYYQATTFTKTTLTKLSLDLYEQLAPFLTIKESIIAIDFLRWGASLYSYTKKYSIRQSEFTFYLLSNVDLDGFSHKEKITLALIASYKSKSQVKKNISSFESWFTKEEIECICAYGAIIKIANALCISSNPLVKEICVEAYGDVIQISFYCKREWIIEEQRVQKQLKHLEKVMKKNIVVTFTQ